jgi:hypothetical protein
MQDGLIVDQGETATTVTHDPSIGDLSDRIVRMQDGLTVDQGETVTIDN